MTRALVYTRVSKEKRSRSVEEQEAECRTVCDREGWHIVDVFTDDGRSASRYAKKGRPEWDKVKERLAAGDVTVLVTWEASRSHRDLAEFVAVRDLCRANGVKLCYSGRTLDLGDTNDSFYAGFDALMSERESDEKSDRILRSLRANAKNGKPHGRRLYGYRRKYDDSTPPKLIGQELDPHEAAVVREVADRVLHGESSYRVVEDLNARSEPTQTGKPWTPKRVRRMCVNPAYAGLRVFQGEVVGDGDWPKILDVETHEALVEMFTNGERKQFKHAPNVTHLLSGIARCGLCGARMYQAPDRGRGVYVCIPGKHHVVRSQDHLDAYVTTLVLERLRDEDLGSQHVGDRDPEVEAARIEAEQLQARLDDAVAQFTTGDLSGAMLATIEKDLKPKIAEAERRARPPTRSPLLDDLAGADIDTRWDALQLEQQREVVRLLLDITVLPSKRKPGSRGFDPTAVRIKWRR
jgi:DNA invertase Pin-like site-specific DNA recombinase